MLKLQQISHAYGKEQVLTDINLTLEANEIVGLYGPSGGGKSTLMKILAGILVPSSGQVVQTGDVGMVFQDYQLFPHMTILQNCCYTPLKVQGKSKAATHARAQDLLQHFGLEALQNKYPAQLSGGQKQRVAIARTMMTEPEIIIFDEPTSALDPAQVDALIQILQELNSEGLTLFIASHEMSFLDAIATRTLRLENGRLHS